MLRLMRLLAKQEDLGSIPALLKCFFFPYVRGGKGKTKYLLILNCSVSDKFTLAGQPGEQLAQSRVKKSYEPKSLAQASS